MNTSIKTFRPISGVLMTPDNQEICYDFYKKGHNRVVIIAHGFFNSKDAILLKELGEELNDEYDVLIMDFRGHGQSKGLFHFTSKEYLDLETVLAFVRQDYARVGVIGFSLGAAISLISASRTDAIDSLISVSAPAAFEKIEYHFWKLSPQRDIFYNVIGNGRIGKGIRPGPFWLKKNRPLDVVADIKAPVYYIHGESDWLILPRHSEQLYERTKTKKDLTVIKRGPHAEYLLLTNKIETVGLIRKWFQETLGEGS